jgi:hypothetical protein
VGTINALLGIAEQYLTLKNTKQSRKYLDRMVYLRRELANEQSKDDSTINHTRIDNIDEQLRILVESISQIGE